MMSVSKKSRIVVVGAGSVGATTAYTLLLRERADEIILVDVNHAKAYGEALDMQHGLPFIGGVRIRDGNYEDCETADIIIITAGAAQGPDETRQDLLTRNVRIVKSIVRDITKYNQDGILLVATNPVDVLSYFAWKESGLVHNRVIGSGTLLDTSRFRHLIGREMNVDPRSVHAHIIGEHGDSEMAVWSRAMIAGMPLDLDEASRDRIAVDTKNAAYEVIKAKGFTSYAIGLALDKICAAILNDEQSVLNVSALFRFETGLVRQDEFSVYLGIPCVVGANGIERTIKPILTPDEQTQFLRSAELLKSRIEFIEASGN